MHAKVNNITTIHEVSIFKIVTENITLANGVTTDVHILRHSGASAIVPLFNSNTVILLKQYRHSMGDYIWEIPAGTCNIEEMPIVCAKRELLEETGYSANKWHGLGEITPAPEYSDERIHVFLATDLESGKQNLDKDELLEAHTVKLDAAMEMIYRGEIQDSKTISALFLARHWLKNQ